MALNTELKRLLVDVFLQRLLYDFYMFYFELIVKFKYSSDQIIPILEAIDTASSYGLNRMNAFFFPSGRTSVFTDFG